MYVRLAFAVAVHTDPDLLLVDEVLAVGDEAFQRKCLDKIRSFQQEGRTIILVSHSLGQVTEMCDRAVLLNKGEVVYDGEPAEAVAQFRNILENRRLDDVAKNPDKEPEPGGHIESAVASPVEGRPGDPVPPGSDLRIRIQLSNDADMPDWVCAIQLDNGLGQIVYGTTTKRLDVALSPFTGTRVVEYILRDVHFGTGKYFVNVSLMDRFGRHLHDLPQACSFDVPDYPLAVGTVHARPEFADLGD